MTAKTFTTILHGDQALEISQMNVKDVNVMIMLLGNHLILNNLEKISLVAILIGQFIMLLDFLLEVFVMIVNITQWGKIASNANLISIEILKGRNFEKRKSCDLI